MVNEDVYNFLACPWLMATAACSIKRSWLNDDLSIDVGD